MLLISDWFEPTVNEINPSIKEEELETVAAAANMNTYLILAR